MDELVNILSKMADEMEKAASIEADVDRVNKMAHMTSAINGLSLIKEAIGDLESLIKEKFYLKVKNF